MRILLTGASGFIGRYCAQLLVERSNEIHVVTTRNSLDNLDLPVNSITAHNVDLLQSAQVTLLMKQVRPTHLLHLAWVPTVPGQFWNSQDNFHWVQASLHLFEQFVNNGGRRVVVAGSCAEYDWQAGWCSEESTSLRPGNAYGICKHNLHTLLATWATMANIELAWGRLFFLYGPGDYQQRLVASLIRSLHRDEAALCRQSGLMRDYLHVADAASALVHLLLNTSSGAFNIASGKPITLGLLAQTIGEIMGKPELVQLKNDISDEPPLLVGDIRQLKSIGWQPGITLSAGLENTIPQELRRLK